MGERFTITVSKDEYETYRFLTNTIARLLKERTDLGPPHHAYNTALHALRELRLAQALKVMEGVLVI